MPMPGMSMVSEAALGSGELVETLLPEEEPDTWAPPQQTVRRADTHRERLVVHPDWTLKAPPILDRSLIPSWGGPEALVHQRLPPHLKADVWYIDRRRGVLTRFHAVPRRRLYVPSQQGVPTGVAWTDVPWPSVLLRRTPSTLRIVSTFEVLNLGETWKCRKKLNPGLGGPSSSLQPLRQVLTKRA